MGDELHLDAQCGLSVLVNCAPVLTYLPDAELDQSRPEVRIRDGLPGFALERIARSRLGVQIQVLGIPDATEEQAQVHAALHTPAALGKGLGEPLQQERVKRLAGFDVVEESQCHGRHYML